MANLAHKTRIHLNNKQEDTFLQWARVRRYAFNFALNLTQIIREQADNKLKLSEINTIDKWFNAGKRPLGDVRMNKDGPALGSGLHTWCKGTPASVSQIAIKYDLKSAWQRFFKGLGRPPKFQGRGRHTSFKLSNVDLPQKAIDAERRVIVLPKSLGSARIGDLPSWWKQAKLNSTTFSCQGKHWYVSFGIEIPDELYFRHYSDRPSGSEVGIDMGVVNYVATSDDETFQAPDDLLRLQQNIDAINKKIGRTLHRQLMTVVQDCERCRPLVAGIADKKRLCRQCRDKFQPNSSRVLKLRERVGSYYAKMAKIRDNMAHQVSAELTQRYERIAIEDLRVRNMTRSAKGDQDNPGKQVRAKAGLNRVILNVSPYRLREVLTYKAARAGGVLVAVNPQNTSRQCAKCGYTDPENRRSQADFVCVQCGHQANADVNAAKNILDRSKQD